MSMFFRPVRDPYPIMFAGRPGVSRKGLRRFLDALVLISEIRDLPPFIGWIVGGDDAEASFIHYWLRHTPSYADLLNTARLFVWEQVDQLSLAELYSRSLVTVVPSSFEQFGLVAVEAMACGCPVVATRTGGLKDSVIPCWTGHLCDADDVETLACAVAGYLRNPAFSNYDGLMARKWAANSFAIDQAMAPLEAILRGARTTPPAEASTQFRTHMAKHICKSAEKVLSQPLELIADVSGKSQISIRVQASSGEQFFVKSFRGRPSSASTYINIPRALLAERRIDSMLAKCRALGDWNVAPAVLADSAHEGVCIFPWVERTAQPWDEYLPQKVRDCFAHRGQALVAPESALKWGHAFRRLMDERRPADLEAFDLASAELQIPLTAGQPVFTETHPQAELVRYRLLADNPTLPLASNSLRRLRDTLDFLLSWIPPLSARPELSHGSLTPENVLRSEPLLVAEVGCWSGSG
ncbi:MAG: glycosyltransferase family 4 protein [Alphaproteobacteria bacterium]|nr:glycosyltransferase family 4 protein [Alphaproteobacteria bacterium]